MLKTLMCPFVFCFFKIRIRVGIFAPEKYRAKVLLIAFDSLHLRSDSCRGSFPQAFFVQNLRDTRKCPEDIQNKPETAEGGVRRETFRQQHLVGAMLLRVANVKMNSTPLHLRRKRYRRKEDWVLGCEHPEEAC